MSPDEFRRYGHQIVDWIADFLADPRQFPVLSPHPPGWLARQLPGEAPVEGESMDQILQDFERLVLPHCTIWNHPRFFSYFAVSSSGPGILAELLAAALNMNGMLWQSSPAVTELEQVTLGWLRQWLGLPDVFFGMIHDTASTSTFHAILAARARAAPEARSDGVPSNLVLYFSEQAHSSVEKAGLAAGLGRKNMRLVATDDRFAMKPESLLEAIRADRAAGLRPMCVVATVGTTSTTAVDPVPAIAEICEREQIWLHVDGAYGGHMAVVPEYRHLLDGVAQADSFVVNPHKWLFTPIDLSAFYIRHPDALREALCLVPAYLRSPSNADAVNFMEYTLPLGRRFRALKLWFVMRYFGQAKIASLIRGHVEMAQRLAQTLQSDERFELCAPHPMSLVCFRLRGSNAQNEELLERLNRSGAGFFSKTVLGGRTVLRWSIGNIHTCWEDLEAALATLRQIATELASGQDPQITLDSVYEPKTS
ncbi:MAG: pyridoxal-dependent decarboxylase [Bryobacteraceae bacterium]|nr:pyridoxal-dependent decarboxylase [Bryobacteraceae bacterium]MDW8379723.1 pyridoxal-dependent decarboxylase [Bryobacterales bacterium]